MSNFIVGNDDDASSSRRSAAIAAITLAVVLMASPILLATTTTNEAFAASKTSSNNDCGFLQFGGAVKSSFPTFADKTVTLATSRNEYSLKLDYVVVLNDDVDTYHKNVGADDPRGGILLPAGKTIIVTFKTQEGALPGLVTLYNHKVSDCQILLDRYVNTHIPDKDKIALKIISVEQSPGSEIVKATLQVPNGSDIPNDFTKLGAQVKVNPEQFEYYIVSHNVQVR